MKEEIIMTNEELKEKVFKNSLNTCEYIEGYPKLKVKCIIHNLEFETNYENVKRNNRAHHICPECQKEDREKRYSKDRTEKECAYCGKKFFVKNSHIKNSKSGMFFCCREHKDLAQRVDSGEKFNSIRPEHFKTGEWNYREKALKEYPHKCMICGWDEDDRILEVHHIDENRENNSIDNLSVLCPTCHRKITLGYYILTKDFKLIKK